MSTAIMMVASLLSNVRSRNVNLGILAFSFAVSLPAVSVSVADHCGEPICKRSQGPLIQEKAFKSQKL